MENALTKVRRAAQALEGKREARDRAIIEARRAGFSSRQIATEAQLSKTQVNRITTQQEK